MPLSPIEELEQIRSQPLPGGHGRIARRREREEELRGQIIKEMFEQMNDVEGVRGLFELYMELLTGKDISDPAICLTEPFKSLWNDYHPEEEPNAIVFQPATQYYGLEILVYDANAEGEKSEALWGILREIKSPHTFVVEHPEPRGMLTWEVDAADDFDPNSEPYLQLWNAF